MSPSALLGDRAPSCMLYMFCSNTGLYQNKGTVIPSYLPSSLANAFSYTFTHPTGIRFTKTGLTLPCKNKFPH